MPKLPQFEKKEKEELSIEEKRSKLVRYVKREKSYPAIVFSYCRLSTRNLYIKLKRNLEL